MNIVDYSQLKKKIIGSSVPEPLSGTLSGHAAGEPFDKHVYVILNEDYPGMIFKQYQYLNDLYSKHPKAITHEERLKLFNSPTVMFLLSRGKGATENWSINNPFEEKQNDTADIICTYNEFYELIDIKTRNMSKNSQPPNIISAYKLAQTCAKMIDNEEYDKFTLQYFGIDWILENHHLVCKNVHVISLFKIPPEILYINWSAAMQIQFHIDDINQSFQDNTKNWTKEYLKCFVSQAKNKTKQMTDKFVRPFEKYI